MGTIISHYTPSIRELPRKLHAPPGRFTVFLRETVILGISDISFGLSIGNFLQLSNSQMRKEFCK